MAVIPPVSCMSSQGDNTERHILALRVHNFILTIHISILLEPTKRGALLVKLRYLGLCMSPEALQTIKPDFPT